MVRPQASLQLFALPTVSHGRPRTAPPVRRPHRSCQGWGEGACSRSLAVLCLGSARGAAKGIGFMA